MRHIPKSSRIFIGVLIITLLLTYIALHFATYVADQQVRDTAPLPTQKVNQESRVEQQSRIKLDTTDWKTYEDATYPVAFSYPKTWTVKPANTKTAFYDIVINPGAKFYDMHVYVSKEAFYGLEGLKQTPIKVGGKEAFQAADNLVGIKVGDTYYTFDGTMNTTQVDEFYTLLDTVKFE